MATCEKCWRDAGGDPDDYKELLRQRKDNPCSLKEQCGERHLVLDYIDGSKHCRCGQEIEEK